ncbi:hypothetical protein K439DRAFT_1665725 [Ramaria rubella]|nr:hypothetical protein K439DRAFT_1665725 [Ramaria rubella]
MQDDPHCGLSAFMIVEFSIYMDATVVGRSACSHTDHQQNYMNIHEHLCSCDDGAMSRCGSKSTLNSREHTLSCSGDTSHYNCNHTIVPDCVSLRSVLHYLTSVQLNLIFLSGFLVLQVNYSLAERTAQLLSCV